MLSAAACSAGGSSPSASGGPSQHPSPPAAQPRMGQVSPLSSPSTTEPPPVPAAPPPRACYQLSFDELAESANLDQPSPCRGDHNSQTIFVGHLHTTAGVDSDAARTQMARICGRKLARYLGGGPSQRHLSRFTVIWFAPTPDQAAAGARWFRCDAIAFGTPSRLYPLPRPRRLHGILDRPHALSIFGLCGTAAPGSAHFARVICAEHHRWRAISTIHLAGGDTYPGRRTVRTTGDRICRERVHAQSGYSLRFRYGWEWPTRQQWRNGQHYGFCWAPD